MKIKHIKFTFLIICIVFLASFNYHSFAADNGLGKTSIDIDSDKDGLSDNEEFLYGTASNKADTDNDGYSDGVEVKSGYDPLKPAPGDKISIKTISSTDNQSTTSEKTLTSTFIEDFQKFIASKNGASISASDVKSFTDTEFAEKVTPTDVSSLPSVEKSQVKIKTQKYSALSESERKKELQKDAANYLNQVIYLFTSNSPIPITTTDDFDLFREDFMNRLADLSDSENTAYFSDLGERLDVFSQQLETLEVPETMVDMHIEFLRIIKGALLLRDPSSASSTDDPMGKIITLTKATDLINIFSDLLSNDFSNYFESISGN